MMGNKLQRKTPFVSKLFMTKFKLIRLRKQPVTNFNYLPMRKFTVVYGNTIHNIYWWTVNVRQIMILIGQ